MEVMNFVLISTDGHFETFAKGEILKDWKFIDISLADQTTIKINIEQATFPKHIWIRDRMLFLDYKSNI
jgi:hypothetical protein